MASRGKLLQYWDYKAFHSEKFGHFEWSWQFLQKQPNICEVLNNSFYRQLPRVPSIIWFNICLPAEMFSRDPAWAVDVDVCDKLLLDESVDVELWEFVEPTEEPDFKLTSKCKDF